VQKEAKWQALLKRRAGGKSPDKTEEERIREEMEIDHDDDDDDDDDGTVVIDTEGLLTDTGGKTIQGWKAKYMIPCRAVSIIHQQKKSVHVLIEVQKLKQERELLFDSMEEAQQFCEVLEKERKLEGERAELRLKSALGDIKLPPFESLTWLIEIVSAWDLPIGDFTSSDPFVVCMLGRRELHRTKHISNT
jgi:hypothetical protein